MRLVRQFSNPSGADRDRTVSRSSQRWRPSMPVLPRDRLHEMIDGLGASQSDHPAAATSSSSRSFCAARARRARPGASSSSSRNLSIDPGLTSVSSGALTTSPLLAATPRQTLLARHRPLPCSAAPRRGSRRPRGRNLVASDASLAPKTTGPIPRWRTGAPLDP